MRKNSFYNTIKADGQTLMNFESSAQSLEAEILLIYRSNPLRQFAWHEINVALINKGLKHHEGSIKRAITNLKNLARIEKTSDMVLGIYGKSVHQYKLI